MAQPAGGGLAHPRRRSKFGAFTPPRRRRCRVAGSPRNGVGAVRRGGLATSPRRRSKFGAFTPPAPATLPRRRIAEERRWRCRGRSRDLPSAPKQVRRLHPSGAGDAAASPDRRGTASRRCRGGLVTSPRRRSKFGAFTPPRRRRCRVAGSPRNGVGAAGGGLATSPRRRSESGAFTPPRRRRCRVAGCATVPIDLRMARRFSRVVARHLGLCRPSQSSGLRPSTCRAGPRRQPALRRCLTRSFSIPCCGADGAAAGN